MSMKTNELKTLEDLKTTFPDSVLIKKYKITTEEVEDLNKRWVNSQQYRTGSPWVQEIQFLEQEHLKDLFAKKFESEIKALVEMLPEEGKTVTVINQHGVKYDCTVTKEGELKKEISKSTKKVSHVNEFRGKDYKHLVWCLSQEELTDGLKRKIKRYILHSL